MEGLLIYNGLAIRRNCSSLAGMQQAIWAICSHKISTDTNPKWFLYYRQRFMVLLPESHGNQEHRNSSPVEVMQAIKSRFTALSSPDLLKKCLHGKTQNPNESLNYIILSRIPKTILV